MHRIIILVSLIPLLTACIGGTSPKTNFYTLDQSAPSVTRPDQTNRDNMAIGLGPIVIPNMLKRPQIVSRDGQHGVVLSEFHHWAGNLNTNMMQVISQELRAQINTDRVFHYPWPAYRQLDYQIRIDVTRFDGVIGGNVGLSGSWTLLDKSANKELVVESFSFEEKAADGNHKSIVAAMSSLTNKLAGAIAARIGDYQSEHK